MSASNKRGSINDVMPSQGKATESMSRGSMDRAKTFPLKASGVENIKTFAISWGTKKNLLIALTAAIVAGGVTIAMSTRTPSTTPPTLEIKTFALGRVQPTSYIRSIQYPMIYTSSRIKSMHVKENDYVRAGDPLFTVEDNKGAVIDMKTSVAQVEQQQAQLKSSEAKMISSKALRDFYKKQFERYRYLSSNGAATREQAEEKQTLFNVSQKEYQSNADLVQANRSALHAMLWQYRSKKFKSELSTIKAPGNVRIYKIYSREGESIQNGKPVMDVGESSSMGVLAEVHRIDIRKIRMGQKAVVTVNGIPTINWTGKVININRQVNIQSIKSDDPAKTVANRVFNVLINLNPADAKEARDYNYMEVNVLFDN